MHPERGIRVVKDMGGWHNVGLHQVEMNGHLARALWTLANLERKNGNDVGAEELRQKAKEVRGRIERKEAPDEDTDESFEALVGYMLW